MTEEEKNEQDTETLLKYFGAHLYNYLTLPHQVSASMADMTQKVHPLQSCRYLKARNEVGISIYFFGTFYF
ncbi:hypothetical protein AALO_G00133220 [Alosa alosa]|uniref:Uncharacterized protein n=1 Tax=Alosa alosa TaxID=278164 RepID=A0AAV6GJL7_9TELE|nr:hypothetical protein AALO_G00133220 [Alosa alosa]